MLKSIKIILCLFFLSISLFADHDQFGICANPAQDSTKAQDLFEKLNASWIRAGYDWCFIEHKENLIFEGPEGTTPGEKIRIEYMDNLVKYAQINNINILSGLSYNPTFYGYGTTKCLNPIHIDKWIRYVTFMVERYDGDGYKDMPGLTKPIKHWEIWNEPNLHGFWTTGSIFYDDLKWFVNYVLIPGIEAIRAADPQAKICGPGLSSSTADGDPIDWFNYMTNNGVVFDVLTHHQYDGGDTASGRFNKLKIFYNNAFTKGYSGKEYWITETGWPNANTSAFQYMQEMFQYMLDNKNWWKKTFWFAWKDTSDEYSLISFADDIPNDLYYMFKNYSNPPFITVVSPNGGESYLRGSTYRIRWNSNAETNVRIELMKGTALNSTITVSPLASTGFYDWTILSTKPTGSDYKIRISTYVPPDNWYILDSSNAPFSICGVPNKPELKSPAENATLCTLRPTLTWYAVTAIPAVDKYQVQINYNGAQWHVSPDLNSTSYTVPAGVLEGGKTYAWYVRAHNSVGWSTWSGRIFNTNGWKVPAKPILESPADNAIVDTTRPTLSWSIVKECLPVDYFQVQINYNGAKLYASGNLTSTSFTVPAGILQKGKTYAWYVRAHNAVGWSGWSGRTINIQ